MPPVRSSTRPDLSNWRPVQATPVRANPPAEPDPTARSPFMQASMPLMASTGDAFARQFYAKNGLPQQRILPAKRGVGV